MKKMLPIFLIMMTLLTGMANAEEQNKVEIFDIKKGKVIKTLPGDEKVQKEVEELLKGITGIYPKFEPIPDKGHMVKVPLSPPVKMTNQWLDDHVTEVIVIFPEYENPHLLVFDSRANSFFFTFNKSTDDFLKRINFTPKKARK